MKKMILKICLISFIVLQLSPSFAMVNHNFISNHQEFAENNCPEAGEMHIHSTHGISCHSCINLFVPVVQDVVFDKVKERHFKPENQVIVSFCTNNITRPPRS